MDPDPEYDYKKGRYRWKSLSTRQFGLMHYELVILNIKQKSMRSPLLLEIKELGPIRQEILSGYSDLKKFAELKDKLSYFENTPILDSDYELAAELCNKCRKKGIQGSHIDFLICAVAKRLHVPVFTSDKDFSHFRRIVSVKLHQIKTG